MDPIHEPYILATEEELRSKCASAAEIAEPRMQRAASFGVNEGSMMSLLQMSCAQLAVGKTMHSRACTSTGPELLG